MSYTSTRRLADSWEQIHRQSDAVAAWARLYFAGPDCAHRYADAALVHILLAGSQRAVVGSDVELAAIVGSEYDQRVIT